ncbi:MAG TPA: Gfo/Idh/MocA family oxidoreductase [archaeon]|jgi:UDP-N-acetylglucosamine 3-dehydrogenase|nr:Gfo/Idh/MocA family oxidoreductase [archaeon]
MEWKKGEDMLNVAVIGVGNMGKHHARVYSQLQQARLVAVCDTDERVGRKIARRFKCNFYPDYKKMLAEESIDAVSIVVPTAYHKKVALDCIERGKHVLVEKPISNNLEDAREIVEAAKVKGVKLAVGHIERFNPAVQKLKEIIKKGELGKITTIVARRVGVCPPQIKDANVIIDTAVHDLDVLSFLLEREPTRIYSLSGKAIIKQRDDYADILLKYDGTNAFIQVNWITPVKIRNLAVTGTEGYAELNYITQDLVMYRSNYRSIDNFSDVVKFGTPTETKVKIKNEEPLKKELADFLDAVEKDREPLVSGKQGLKTLETVLKIIESSGKC